MNELIVWFAALFCIAIMVLWILSVSKAVENARIEEMVEDFWNKSNFELLQLKELLVKGKFNLSDYEVGEVIQAINITLKEKQR